MTPSDAGSCYISASYNAQLQEEPPPPPQLRQKYSKAGEKGKKEAKILGAGSRVVEAGDRMLIRFGTIGENLGILGVVWSQHPCVFVSCIGLEAGASTNGAGPV